MTFFTKFTAGFVLVCGLSAHALAQDETPPPPPQQPPAVCLDNEKFLAFDFWVGEGNVYATHPKTGERVLAGHNSVTKHYANCLIVEKWQGQGGSEGMSMNFYDPIEDQWRQLWVSANLSINYTGGLNDAGQMVLDGDIHYYTPEGGTTFPFRGIWTLEDDGSVTQHFDQFDPESGEWQVWFEGYYVREDADTN